MSDTLYPESFVDGLRRLNAERCEEIGSLQSRLTAAENRAKEIEAEQSKLANHVLISIERHRQLLTAEKEYAHLKGLETCLKACEDELGSTEKERDEAQADHAGCITRWREALTNPIPVPGVMREPAESLYRQTEALRTNLVEAQARVKELESNSIYADYAARHHKDQQRIEALENALREAKEALLLARIKFDTGKNEKSETVEKALQTLSALSIE